MAMVATVVDTVDTEATTARGMLMPRLPPPLKLMLSPAMATDTVVDMAMVDTDTARGLLRLMLSPDTDTTAVDTDMAVDMDMAVMDVSMEDTDTARGPLRLMLSPDMDTTAVDMDMVATDTDVSMVDMADTMDKSKSNQSSFLHSNIHSCSKIESCFTS